jgi:ABC-2 type transport system permease protein
VPQIFFSGLFDLPPGMEVVGYVMPLYYIADALTEVMIRGSGFSVIAGDLGIILAWSLLFMTLNTLLLKKYRRV